MSAGPAWLAALARLGPDDLRRISALVDRLITADRAAAETAQTMLRAAPVPTTHEEARARCESITAFLERSRRSTTGPNETAASRGEAADADSRPSRRGLVITKPQEAQQ